MNSGTSYWRQSTPSRRRQVWLGLAAVSALTALYAASLYFSRFNLALIAAAAISVAALIFEFPILGAMLVVIAHTTPIWALHPTISFGLMILTSGMVLLRGFLRRDPVIRVHPTFRWALLFYIWYVTTIVWAGVYDQFNLYPYLYIIAAFFMFAQTVRTPKDFALIILAAAAGVIVSSVTAIKGVYDFYLSGEAAMAIAVTGDTKNVRFYGGWPGPNELGQTFVPFLAFCFAVARTRFHIFARWLAGLAIILGILAVFVSLSRGAILCLLIQAVLIFAVDKRRWLLLGATVLIVGLTLYLIPVDLIGRVSSIAHGRGDASINERSQVLEGGIRMIEDSFPFGVGAANFRSYSADYAFLCVNGMLAHNTYIDVVAESGLVGTLLFIGLGFSFLNQMRGTRWRMSSDDFSMNLKVCLHAAVISMFVAFLFNSYLPNIEIWIPLAIISLGAMVLDGVRPSILKSGDTFLLFR